MLWFDAIGASNLGIGGLSNQLKRVRDGEFDPKSEGKIILEKPATAVLDGERGIPLLVLGKGAEIAAEKARDVGVGLVRVENIGTVGSAAEVACGVAVGPFAAVIVGPDPSWTVAIPSLAGLPAVFDSALGKADSSLLKLIAEIAPWVSTFATGEGWIIGVISITSLESVSSFQERVARTIEGYGNGQPKGKRWLMPEELEAGRIAGREGGVPIPIGSWKPLVAWAERLGVTPPTPAE